MGRSVDLALDDVRLHDEAAVPAGNGSHRFVSGAPDPRWSNEALHTLGRVPGSAFELVDASSLRRQ